VNLWKFVVYVKDELFLVLGTASTEEGQLDRDRMRSVLDGRPVEPLDDLDREPDDEADTTRDAAPELEAARP
jgi:hypothetical protein